MQPESPQLDNLETDSQTLAEAFDEWAAYERERLKKVEIVRANVQGRAAACGRGDPIYSGTKCKVPGHGSLRRTSTGVCIRCHRGHSRKYRELRKAELEELRATVEQLSEQNSTTGRGGEAQADN